MNLRPIQGIQELADMMKKGTKAKWGNQIGYLIYPFTIALRDNPLDYLREAKTAIDRKKASLEASFSYFLAKYFLKFGGLKGLMIHVVSYANKMTFILSVDDDIIPDPHQLCDDLEVSLNRIKTAVIN
ncbi:hypothetical protein Pint_07629 [Pistacia integerrima]|uniref:Uncharacterized protein n=1 Tax=Pistacia integerrima TaxID=434235 RepID=A0ACC0XYC0_9ROSI|nr:hypothetical protein Pint_07629 [Pistacia integerrima]